MQQPETAGVAQRTTPNGMYGGTKEEMVRLVNESGILGEEIEDLDGITFDQLVLAIHKIQQEMGITGTTAKEAAETISGSKASLSAAWQDLLSAVGGEGDQARLDETLENFKTSFSTYMEQFAPTLVKTISNSGSLVTAIADAIGDLPKDLLAQVASSGLEAGTEAVSGVSKITGWLIDSLVRMFESAKANPQSLQEFGSAIGEFLGTTISDVVLNAPAIIEGIFNVGLNIAGGFIDGLINGLSGRKSEVQQITDQMQEDIANADVDYSKAESLIRYLEKLQKKYGKTAAQTAEWKKTMVELDKILPGAGEAAMKYGTNLEGAIENLREMNEQTRKQLVLSALQEAGNKQLAAIGAKQGELTESQIRQEQAQSAVETITPDLVENLQAYAKEMLRMNAEQDFMGPEMLEYYRALSSGTDAQGNALGTYDVDQLVSILTQVGRAIEERYDEDEPYIWDRDMNDNLMDVETLAKKAEAIKTAQVTIQQEIEKQAQLQTEIAELEEGYQTTWEALTRTVDGITANAEAGGKAVEKGGETTKSAIQTAGGSAAAGIGSAGRTLAQTLTEINDKLPVPYMGPVLPKAIGMNYVPYDGFRASLHRGEEVLTATQARAYRNGGDTSGMVEALQALRQDLQNLRLVVGKKTFGRAVVDYGGSRVDGYIGEAESRYYAGYGT